MVEKWFDELIKQLLIFKEIYHLDIDTSFCKESVRQNTSVYPDRLVRIRLILKKEGGHNCVLLHRAIFTPGVD
jgi:hypothetical protein